MDNFCFSHFTSFFMVVKIFNNIFFLLTFKSALNFLWIVELTSKNRINLGRPHSTGLVVKVIMSVLNCSYAPMSTRMLLERMVKARIYKSLRSFKIQSGGYFCVTLFFIENKHPECLILYDFRFLKLRNKPPNCNSR